jgi:hypothetical protein
MALIDRMKAGANQAVQKAQEAGREAQSRLDDLQARRALDALYRDLGEATHAALRVGGAVSGGMRSLVASITAHLEEHGTPTDESEGSTEETPAPPLT